MAFRGADTKQRLKGGHWYLPSIESENKLVQIDLKIFWFNAVVSSHKPGLEVGKDSMDVRRQSARTLRRVLDFDNMPVNNPAT